MTRAIFYAGLLVLLAIGTKGIRPRAPTGVKVDWTKRTGVSFVIYWDQVQRDIRHEIVLRDFGKDWLRENISIEAGISWVNVSERESLVPWSAFDVFVYAINAHDERSIPSQKQFIRLPWTHAYKAQPRPKRVKLTPEMVPVDSCGPNKFTCHDGVKCLSWWGWCNGRIQCSDGSDERHCPGGCKELDFEKFINGNMSCTVYGSPDSQCAFTCFPGYKLHGNRYTMCTVDARRWTHDIPKCLVMAPAILSFSQNANYDVTVEWSEVPHAVTYNIQLTKQITTEEGFYVDGESFSDEFVVTHFKDDKLSMTLENIGEYEAIRLVLFAVDVDGNEGFITDETYAMEEAYLEESNSDEISN